MKKLRILIILVILAFSFSVKAEVFFEVDCNSKDITSDKSVTCEGNLSYETEGINDIEISYQTNLDIKFLPVDGFTINNSNGVLTIHTDDTLYDELMMSSKIMEFTLSSNDNVKDEEELKFYNIRINKENTNVTDDLFETFKVSLPDKEEPKLDNVCTLESIMVDNTKISNFDKNKFEYRDINVNKRIVFIDATRTSNKSSATELGDVKVLEGETIVHNVIVTAEDGTKCIYKLYITNNTPKEEKEELEKEEVKSKDNTLKSLEIYHQKDKIKFDFNNKKDEYNIDIAKISNDIITIKAVLNDSKASFIKGYGPRDVNLIIGNNKILIKTKSENGEEKTITLNIKYLDDRDMDNSLLSLKINDETINLADEKLEIKVAHNIDKAKIDAIAKSDKAIIKYEDIELKVGDNNVNISVTAENGDTKEYNIKVTREEEEKIFFQNIEISGYDLNFVKDNKTYNLKINNETNKLDIKVVPSDISMEILGNDNLDNGSIVTIKITDSDGIHEYNINIIKDSDNKMIYYIIAGLGAIALITLVIYIIKKKHR